MLTNGDRCNSRMIEEPDKELQPNKSEKIAPLLAGAGPLWRMNFYIHMH